jgi:hypothetical protein
MRTNYPMRDIGREMDCEAIKRNALYDQGVLVVRLDDPRWNDVERQFLKNIAEKRYGKRNLCRSLTR